MTRVTLTLPKPMDSYQACLTHAQQEFCKKFGGFTSYEANGGWRESDGSICKEPVTVIEAYTDLSHPNAVIFMDGVAEYIMGRNGYEESAIMFTVNNDQYLVESADGERLKISS
jgi:hypothetical protein